MDGLAGLGEADRVREQIEQDLAQALGIGAQRAGLGRDIDLEPELAVGETVLQVVAPQPVPRGELRIASAPDHAALATVDSDVGARPVQINLEELSVRIVGYNFALAALEARLTDQSRWSAAELEPVVQQLAELGQLRSMLAGYREFVVQTAPVRLGQLEPLRPVVTSVAARISSARWHSATV